VRANDPAEAERADDLATAEDRLRSARVLVEIGDLFDAEAAVAAVLEAEPDNVSAFDLLAKLKHMRGELSAAIACWAQVHSRSREALTAQMRLGSLLQFAQNSERGSGPFMVLGPFQLWRKPAAHLELEEVFRLFLARRPDEARARCEQLAAKYRERDIDLYRLAVMADAWVAELSGDLESARAVLERLGDERGFETDGDRILALARVYERIGTRDLLERAVQIYRHLERSYERVTVLGRLATLYRRLGNREDAARYDERFLTLFRERMHRPSLPDVARVAARTYLPLVKLSRIRLATREPLASPNPREAALQLFLEGDREGAAELFDGWTEVLDLRYRADLAALAGRTEEAVSLYLDSLEADPGEDRVVEWLLAHDESDPSPRIRGYFARAEVAGPTIDRLQAAVRVRPLRPSLWRQLSSLHRIAGHPEEAGRCAERAEALEEAAARAHSAVGRALADSVYHLLGRSKGLVHEVWATRRPAQAGRGGFLEEVLGNLTPEFSQAVRNTFLSVREYARAKWPHQTRDILDYSYTYKVTKEDEPSGGLSAGLPSALAFLSVFLNRPLPQDIASSGVLVADSHDVLVLRAVGEPEYKVRGAYNRNLRRVILPEANRRDLEDNPCVPRAICDEVVHYASNLDEAVVANFGPDVWIS
jgi:tetratricopeptide (TPR) repeat protein